jgi:hypothetical protein
LPCDAAMKRPRAPLPDGPFGGPVYSAQSRSFAWRMDILNFPTKCR